jgi:hypothetical protein
MNVQMWYDDSEKLDFHFREHSFLNNPRTPRELKRSRGTVTFCGHDKFQPGQVRARLSEMTDVAGWSHTDSVRGNKPHPTYQPDPSIHSEAQVGDADGTVRRAG